MVLLPDLTLTSFSVPHSSEAGEESTSTSEPAQAIHRAAGR